MASNENKLPKLSPAGAIVDHGRNDIPSHQGIAHQLSSDMQQLVDGLKRPEWKTLAQNPRVYH